MKGFLVVDRLNEIHFIDTDKEFARHINEQAKESGLLHEDCNDIYTIDPTIVMQQFSPLFISQWFMIDHLKNPCSVIRCENDFIYAFRHCDDYLLVAINGDGTESEQFLTRKLLVFIRMIGFIVGPVIKEIGQPRFMSKVERWDCLRLLLSTWVYLANNEQSFLVEAVEKLHVNQVVSEQCVEILQTAANRIQEAGENNIQHVLLLVNSKLLSLYSSRHVQELQSSDILCIILLVRSLFPTHERLEDLFAHSYNPNVSENGHSPAAIKVTGLPFERYVNAYDGFTTGEETENEEKYYSAREGAKDESPRWSDSKISDSGSNITTYPEVSENFVTPTVSPSFPTYTDTAPDINEPEFHQDDHFTESLLLESAKSSHLTSLTDETESVFSPSREDVDYIKMAAFLSTPVCKYTPNQIHCRRLYPGIILCVLTKMRKCSQAPKLVHLLQLFKDLMSGHSDIGSRLQGQMIYDVINKKLTKVLTSLKKDKGILEKLCKAVKEKWEDDEVKVGIIAYQGSKTEISGNLGRALRFLHVKLTEVFLYLFVSPQPTSQALALVFTSVAEMFMKQLGDYKDYLNVKVQRNITMTAYIEDFPGLIHFIYVNRHNNQIMAPSLNITHMHDNTKADATQLFKEKIWHMMAWMQCKLHEGNTTVIARHGDFQYSYFLWFENCNGSLEVIQRPYKADCTAPPPGILTGSFYKYLTHKCFLSTVPASAIYCKELFMMHVGLVNAQYIARHCRLLAARLNETASDMLTNLYGNNLH